MDKCILVLKNVASPIGEGYAVLGDVFLTDNQLIFLGYTTLDMAAVETAAGSLGKFTVAGTLMGGLDGRAVGKAIDELAVLGGDSCDYEQKVNCADQARREDYGLSIEDRLKKRKAVVINRGEVAKVQRNEFGMCVIETTNVAASLLILHDLILVNKDGDRFTQTWIDISRDAQKSVSRAQIADLLSQWLNNSLEEQPPECLQGTRIGENPN
jgi:hypothetical protein